MVEFTRFSSTGCSGPILAKNSNKLSESEKSARTNNAITNVSDTNPTESTIPKEKLKSPKLQNSLIIIDDGNSETAVPPFVTKHTDSDEALTNKSKSCSDSTRSENNQLTLIDLYQKNIVEEPENDISRTGTKLEGTDRNSSAGEGKKSTVLKSLFGESDVNQTLLAQLREQVQREQHQRASDALLSEDHQQIHSDCDHLFDADTQQVLVESQKPTVDRCAEDKLSYQLRAFSDNISSLGSKPWNQVSILHQNIHVSSLSSELVNETLNYFLNCGQRLSQMTKTFDDHDAYILLLQEKEVDLELAARIGQDLLTQNKQLRETIKTLEGELLKRQDEIQQLKHELASKTTLLDTFIEEEEHQTSRIESEDDFTNKHQESISKHSSVNCLKTRQLITPSDDCHRSSTAEDNYSDSAFLSLNPHRPGSSNSTDPFTSLPHSFENQKQEKDRISHNKKDDTSNGNVIDGAVHESSGENIKLVQSVTFQLVESNKRLCELQDELFYKSEQNITYHDTIRHLQEQLRESEQRLNTVASDNESLQKTIYDSDENQKNLAEELRVCKRNFSELLEAFLELQKEARILRNRTLQERSTPTYPGDLDPLSENNNISYDTGLNLATDYETSDDTGYGSPGASNDDHENSVQGDTDNDSNNTQSWNGLSSFMLTTLILLCLSVTLTSSSGYNLTSRLPIKFDK